MTLARRLILALSALFLPAAEAQPVTAIVGADVLPMTGAARLADRSWHHHGAGHGRIAGEPAGAGGGRGRHSDRTPHLCRLAGTQRQLCHLPEAARAAVRAARAAG